MNCCEDMKEHLEYTCDEHGDECPDKIIKETSTGLGIPIHDGGSSYIEVKYCPWCGTEVVNKTEE